MRKSHFPTSRQAALCPRYLLRQEMPTFCLCTKAYRYWGSVHVQTLWQDGLQTDALPRPCDSHGLEHVLPGQELISQYRLDSADCDESPGLPHDHQQLVYPFRLDVPKHRYTAHSGAQFQLWRVARRKTVVKMQGVKYYLWLILDSEARFVSRPTGTVRRPLPYWMP